MSEVPMVLPAGLDADVLAMLDGRGAPPNYADIDVHVARRAVEERPRKAGPPVHSSVDHQVDGAHGTFTVRVLRPRPDAVLPAVLYFHGGGMVVGSIDSFDAVARSIAVGADVVVVNVDYALAPEHRFPVATDQAYEALCWVHENAEALGVDGSAIGVAGDSAGGQLAAGVALQARDQGGPELLVQVLVYPGVDVDWDFESAEKYADGPVLTRTNAEWFKEQYQGGVPREQLAPYGAPALAEDLSGLPAALVVTAEFDVIRDGCERYARRLAEAGTAVTAVRHPGVCHGFLTQDVKRAELAMSDICHFLRSRVDLRIPPPVGAAAGAPDMSKE